MLARRHRPVSLAVTALLALVTFLWASPAVAAGVAPNAPVQLGVTVGVDGISVGWFRGDTQTGGVPTSYVVHRRAPGHDADWPVPTAPSTSWSYSDATAPVGVDVTYTVTARNSSGDSPESAPITARVPDWTGPYEPDHTSLTLVWDEAEGGREKRDSVVAGSTTTPALRQAWENGYSFSTGNWREALVLPRNVTDGTYTIGDAEGQLPLRAAAGDFCGSPAGGAAPGGSAKVSRTAMRMDGTYASISVDATFTCENGHSLRAELRWHTPDPITALSAPDLSVATANPGGTATTVVTVSNTGTESVGISDARFVDAALSTSAPLSVTASTCVGVTLAQGATCTVSVRYEAGAAGSKEAKGDLALLTDVGEWEVGAVVGQQPPPYSGPQALAGQTAPGRLTLKWSAPSTIDYRLISGYRLEDVSGPEPVVLQASLPDHQTTTALNSPRVGTHVLRVAALTTDGRALPSAPITLTVASRWLLVATTKGVLSFDADGGTTNGGLFGTRATSTGGIAASPTRTALVVSDGPYSGSVWRTDQLGVAQRSLTHDGTFADRGPDVSPDGAIVALLRTGYTGEQNRPSALITTPMAGGGAVTEVPTSSGLSSPAWTHDGRELVAAADAGGDLVRINPTTGARSTIPGTTGAAVVAVSRTGRLAYALSGWGGSGEIRVSTLAGGTSTLVGTHTGATDLSWDPTGQWLAVTGAMYGDAPTTSLYDLRSATPTRVRQLPGGNSITWLVAASAAPVAAVTSAAWTTAAATLSVTASDPDDAPGGLRRECRLDGGAWTPCGATWSLSGLAAGQHRAAVRVTDPSGQVSPIVERVWSVDTSTPTVALTVPATPAIGTSLKVTWTTADSGGSGLGAVDVRYRSANVGSGYGPYVQPSYWQSLKTTSLTALVTPGLQYCFSSRVRDVAGNTGPWSADRCTAIALDDKALVASSTRWTRGQHSAYAYGTYSRAAYSGVTLTSPNAQARRIAVVVTTCPTCGMADVSHAGINLGRINLHSATTAFRQVKWLPMQTTTRTGKVIVKTTSSKQVIIDGLVVWH